jgi:hypothetical protein
MLTLHTLLAVEFNQTHMDELRVRVQQKLDFLKKDYTCMLYGGSVSSCSPRCLVLSNLRQLLSEYTVRLQCKQSAILMHPGFGCRQSHIDLLCFVIPFILAPTTSAGIAK